MEQDAEGGDRTPLAPAPADPPPPGPRDPEPPFPEDQYRAVVEDQTEIIVRFQADGTLTFVNDVYCRFFGRSRQELVGTRWHPVAVAEDVPRIESALATLSPANPVVVIENRVHRGDGEVRWMQFVNRAFFDGAGALRHLQAVGRDITDRRRVEEELGRQRQALEDLVRERTAALARSEAQYRALVEASPDAVLAHAEGRVLYANPAAARIFRAPSPEALVGMSLLDLVHPDSRPGARERLQAAYGEDRPLPRAEQRGLTLDGTELEMDVETVPLRDGGAPAALSVVRDITAQRRLEREVRNAQKLESVGQLAGGIAHDFNNLLSAILGNVSLARLRPADAAEVDDLLEAAQRAVERAMGLTRQLLTFARGGAPVRHPTVLSASLRDTAEFALRGSRVACRFDIAPDLWPADVDAGQVSQVIHNLVLNAEQAMARGGTVDLQAGNVRLAPGEVPPLPAGPYVRIAVRDAGPGIPAELRDRVFEPYFTTKPGGSGLGLAVCHSIVVQHGGAIRLESEVGRGSTFLMYLPAIPGEGAAPSLARPTPIPRPTGRRVLLMDDDEALRFSMTRILKALGYRADAVSDGEAALQAYDRAREEGQPFEAVILDLTVPGGMGGQEAAARLLERDPAARLVVSSGYSDDPVMADPGAHGFRGVLPKPCHVDAVETVLRKVLQS